MKFCAHEFYGVPFRSKLCLHNYSKAAVSGTVQLVSWTVQLVSGTVQLVSGTVQLVSGTVGCLTTAVSGRTI